MTPSVSRTLALVFFFLAVAGCGDEPREGSTGEPTLQTGGEIVSAGDFRDNPNVLSPPILIPPTSECATAVRVKGFVPGAVVRILNGAAPIGEAIGWDPDGQMIPLTDALEDGWVITAVQIVGGVTSPPSNAESVVDHLVEYPSGLPRPELNVLPLYRCGIATVVDNLPMGGDVNVFSDALSSPIGHASGVNTRHSVGIGPAFELGHGITAQSNLCTTDSPISAPPRIVQTEPSSLPAPGVPELYEGGSIIVVGNLVNGARVRIDDAATGDPVSGGGAPAGRVRFPASPPVTVGQMLEVQQNLCPGNDSPVTTVTVHACTDLPAPVLISPQPGDTHVVLTNVVAGAEIRIYAGGVEIGDGGGAEITLTRPVVAGETLVAVQIVGNCQSSQGYAVVVGSGLEDPGGRGSCQVESFDYDEGTFNVAQFFNSPSTFVDVPMSAVPVRGKVFYPIGTGRYPVFMIVHGNASPLDPSYRGYDYLLEHLASHCIIGVSIDEYFLNGRVSGEMDARGIVMLRHLQQLRAWDQDPSHELFTKIDTGNVMVSGHSRGGEAAVVTQKFNQWLHNPADPYFDYGFGIRSIYAIAPVDGQLAGDSSAPISGFPLGDLTVQSADYMVIHGSHDGDVATFDGHRTYDRAHPVNQPTSKLKALRFVHGANHKQFNTVWESGTPDYPPTETTANVQTINKINLTAYAFATLKGWTSYRAFLKREATFPSYPSGVTVMRQYQDPDREFINHYEEDDDPDTASLTGASNNASGSALTVYNDIDFDAPGPPNWLWEQTDGALIQWSGGTNGTLTVRLDGDLQRLIDEYPVLAFRVGQVFEETDSLNTTGVDKDLSVRVNIGSTPGAPVLVSDYAALVYPVDVSGTWTDMYFGFHSTKTIMSTVRIPWSDLISRREADFSAGWEIVFEFDRHSSGRIVLDEIQASK